MLVYIKAGKNSWCKSMVQYSDVRGDEEVYLLHPHEPHIRLFSTRRGLLAPPPDHLPSSASFCVRSYLVSNILSGKETINFLTLQRVHVCRPGGSRNVFVHVNAFLQ